LRGSVLTQRRHLRPHRTHRQPEDRQGTRQLYDRANSRLPLQRREFYGIVNKNNGLAGR
jgi:hypothetical protein